MRRTYPTERAASATPRVFKRRKRVGEQVQPVPTAFMWRGVKRAWHEPHVEGRARARLEACPTVSVSEPLWNAIAAHARARDVSVGAALDQILDQVLRTP